MEPRKIYADQFVDTVRKLENAKDRNGNVLYDREDIASYMGFNEVLEFESTLKKCRKLYRESLQKIVRELKEKGLDVDEIIERTAMSRDTIKVLLDIQGDEGQKRADELKKAQDDFFKKTMEDFDKNQKELNKLFGNKSIWDL